MVHTCILFIFCTYTYLIYLLYIYIRLRDIQRIATDIRRTPITDIWRTPIGALHAAG